MIDASLKKAKAAFDSGKTKSVDFRVSQLANLKKGLQTMQREMTDAVKKDLGRDYFATWFMEISILEHEINFAIANLGKWTSDHNVDTPMFLGPARSKIVYEPLGVVCVMGSWNFPLFTTIGPLINVIAAGNCAIIKPSELAPYSLIKIKSLVTRWLDLSCYICIEGQVEVAKALSTKKFDSICFTGSTDKGKLVAAAAARNLVPCILELGGKSPVIVDETADLDFAVKKIVQGKFMNAGQVCIAPDYVLIHYSLVERFIRHLAHVITEMWDNGNNVTDMGKVINDFHHNRLCELLRDH